MGILSALFGKSKNVGKAIDAVGGIVDSAFFTEQEKSLAGIEYLKLQIEMAKALGPSNIARRVIAITIVVAWVFNIELAIGLYAFGATDIATFVFNIVKDVLTLPFTIVVGFYFAKQIVTSMQK